MLTKLVLSVNLPVADLCIECVKGSKMFSTAVDGTGCINPTSPVALYQQLSQMLRQQIESGQYKPGDRFPTSRELCERYQVSTTTVERSLRWLAERGLIHRRPGRGTVVSAPPVKEELARLTGLTEAAEAQGLEFENRVLRADFFQPTQRQAEILALRPGEKAFRLDRLNMIREDEPIGVELGIYTPDVGERFMAEPNTMSAPLYRTFETRFGLKLDRASQTIGAMPAGRREAGLLGLPVGSPLVYFDRVTYLDNGRPFQFVRCCLPSTRYSFHVWLKRYDSDPKNVLSFGSDQITAVAVDSWSQ